MQVERTNRFRKTYRRLSSQDRERVDKAIEMFMVNPLDASLGVEKIAETASKWSFRASSRIRCTFDFGGGLLDLNKLDSVISLGNVGGHEVYKSP